MWRYLAGLAFGVLLSCLYVWFDWSPPGILQLPEKAASAAILMAATENLYDPTAENDVRKRALAVVVGHDPDFFMAVDEALGGAFYDEALRRKAVSVAKPFKHRMRAYDAVLERPPLRKVYERKHNTTDADLLKRRMFIDDLKDNAFLYRYLRDRFDDRSDDELADMVLAVYQTGFKTGLPQPPPRAAIRRRSPIEAPVKTSQ